MSSLLLQPEPDLFASQEAFSRLQGGFRSGCSLFSSVSPRLQGISKSDPACPLMLGSLTLRHTPMSRMPTNRFDLG